MSTATPHASGSPLPDGRGLRIGVVAARFNADITDRLLAGALRGLTASGVAAQDVAVVRVPGAVELPLAAARFFSNVRRNDAGREPSLFGGFVPSIRPFDAVVALGCVIRGDTTHYDYVCRLAADGVLRVMLDAGKPVAFGVLTCDTKAQALARAGDGDDNKGFEAAMTAVETARFQPKFAP